MNELNEEEIAYLQFLLFDRLEFLKTDKSQPIDYKEIEYVKELNKKITSGV